MSMLVGPLAGPRSCPAQGCAAKSSMLGDLCLVVVPLSLTLSSYSSSGPASIYRCEKPDLWEAASAPFEFWGFRFGGASDTRVRDGGALCAGALRALSGNREDGKDRRRSRRLRGIDPLQRGFATFRQESGVLGRRAG